MPLMKGVYGLYGIYLTASTFLDLTKSLSGCLVHHNCGKIVTGWGHFAFFPLKKYLSPNFQAGRHSAASATSATSRPGDLGPCRWTWCDGVLEGDR